MEAVRGIPVADSSQRGLAEKATFQAYEFFCDPAQKLLRDCTSRITGHLLRVFSDADFAAEGGEVLIESRDLRQTQGVGLQGVAFHMMRNGQLHLPENYWSSPTLEVIAQRMFEYAKTSRVVAAFAGNQETHVTVLSDVTQTNSAFRIGVGRVEGGIQEPNSKNIGDSFSVNGQENQLVVSLERVVRDGDQDDDWVPAERSSSGVAFNEFLRT